MNTCFERRYVPKTQNSPWQAAFIYMLWSVFAISDTVQFDVDFYLSLKCISILSDISLIDNSHKTGTYTTPNLY